MQNTGKISVGLRTGRVPVPPYSTTTGVPTPGSPDEATSHRPYPSRASETQKELKLANIKSQKKRIKTNEKRRMRNKAVKSELKTLVRKTREAIAAKDAETAEIELRVAARKLDKAVSKGVIHRNQAANRKSKLARQIAALAREA